MEPFSLLWILIIAVLVVVLGSFLSKILKVLFYALLAVFVLVLLFGVSYYDLIDWASKIVLWVF